VRIAGWILLLIGFLLCISVAWATLGFLLMGVGLVSLQVPKQNRRRVPHAARAERLEMPLRAVARPRAEEPVIRREPALAPAPEVAQTADLASPRFDGSALARSVAAISVSAKPSYDKEAWHHLIEQDPDLAQLASVLADYGQPYVDELAMRYLAAPDKSRLGAIVDGIVANARAGPPSPPVTEPPIASTPAQEAANPRDALGSSEPSTAADDELTEMIRQLGPASSLRRRG
jgi:hypothetical protein